MDINDYIDNAIKTHKEITIKYQKYDGTISTRRISSIEYSDEFGEGYIHAYCHLRSEERTFKISRILEVDGYKVNNSSPSSYTSTTSYSPTPRYSPYSNGQKSYQSSNKSEGCYIATMAYGDYDHPQVVVLRNYRDQILAKSIGGRLFIHLYYSVSPKLVIILRGHNQLNNIIRKLLDNCIDKIKRKHKRL